MERKIGEIFEYNGEWFQCVEGLYCDDCAFVNDNCEDRERITLREKLTKQPTTGFCNSEKRNDRKSVIFKKLEKVGEPMKIHNRLVLKVKADAYKCMRCCYYSKAKCELTIQECKRYDCGEGTKFIEIKENKEDMEDLDKIKVRDYTKVEELNVMEEKKLNLKPFDIQKAREGKPVCTRDGRKASIICFDAKMERNIIALIQDDKFKDEEIAVEYFPDGCFYDNGLDTSLDLMMLPEKRSGWAKNRKDINLYNTKEEADRKMIGNDEYVTAKVCWEE